MTAAEWMTTDDIKRMILSRGYRNSEHRLRLFILACCDAAESPPEIRSLAEGIRTLRRSIEGKSTVLERVHAKQLAVDELQRWSGQHPNHSWALAALELNNIHFGLLYQTAWHMVSILQRAASPTHVPTEGVSRSRFYAGLAREVFGPLRKQRLLVRWRTETVRLLADGIQADRAFDRLPILTDALEEAGCDNAELLAHCRGSGPHVPGCWALDLVRGVY